jgi:outer membrane protein assembly factor BamB
MILRLSLAAIAVSLCVSLAGAAELARSSSWHQWRGPNRDGKSPETGLLDSWPEKGPPIAWRTKGLGRGFSSVAVVGGRIYTIGNRNGKEMLICLSDTERGRELWATPFGGGSPNGTPTVDGDPDEDGLVFCIGNKGDMLAADAKTGKEQWRKNFRTDFDGKMHSGWGYSESPLVDGDTVIFTPGAEDAMLVKLDKKTGDVIWKAKMPNDVGDAGGDGAAYSSVVISKCADVKQYVQLVGRGVIGVRASDGKVLWIYNRIANGTANIPTPIIKDDYVFCSTGYGTGAALLKLVPDGDGGVKAEEQYFLESKKMQNHHGGMILLGDHIYCGHGHNEGFPLCIEMLTGKEAWKPGRGAGSGSAAVAYADGHIYFRYQNGVMALVEATPERYKLKSKFDIASKIAESWPHPVIAGGKLYLRDQDVLLCYDIQKK